MQVSSKLRRVEGGFAHWCPACEEVHILPDRWQFDGNLENPTFQPSFRHTGLRMVYVGGKWTGEWVRNANGNVISRVCHYNLTAGQLQYCADSTHGLAGRTVPLPLLPEGLTDEG